MLNRENLKARLPTSFTEKRIQMIVYWFMNHKHQKWMWQVTYLFHAYAFVGAPSYHDLLILLLASTSDSAKKWSYVRQGDALKIFWVFWCGNIF